MPTLLQESVGVGETQARLLTAGNGTIYLGAALICLLIIDSIGTLLMGKAFPLSEPSPNPATGRRKMMLYGSLTMGTWYLIAAVTLQQANVYPEKKQALGSATTAMFFLYYFCYGTSFAKVPWVYNSEVSQREILEQHCN